MAVPWMALVGLGLGAYKYDQDQKKEDRDRRLAATTAQYRPWTGLTPNEIREADPYSTMGAGAFQGYAMDQQAETNDSNAELRSAQRDYFKAAAKNMTPPNNSTPPTGTPPATQPANLVEPDSPEVPQPSQLQNPPYKTAMNPTLWQLLMQQGRV